MAPPSIDSLRDEYERLYTTCSVKPERSSELDAVIDRIAGNRARYEGVLGHVPWFVIGIIHSLEASLNFSTHLHNGDPLSGRTVHVPAGRPPPPANPPFSWETSAADALSVDGLGTWADWTVTGILYKLEAFNGFGYRTGHGRPIPSPYLWSFSQHYSAGKFSADGHFDPALVSAQAGGAVLLHQMVARQLVQPPVPLRAPVPPGV